MGLDSLVELLVNWHGLDSILVWYSQPDLEQQAVLLALIDLATPFVRVDTKLGLLCRVVEAKGWGLT